VFFNISDVHDEYYDTRYADTAASIYDTPTQPPQPRAGRRRRAPHADAHEAELRRPRDTLSCVDHCAAKMSALVPAEETDGIIVGAGAPPPGAGYTWEDTHFNEARCKLHQFTTDFTRSYEFQHTCNQVAILCGTGGRHRRRV
jgi:hypothetical protein